MHEDDAGRAGNLLIRAKPGGQAKNLSQKVVEEALRRMFARAGEDGKTRFDFPVFDGRTPFLVDVNDRRRPCMTRWTA